MLYHWIYPLHEYVSAFNVLRYITVRTFFAIFIAMGCFMWLAPWVIRFIARHQFTQTVRTDGPASHLSKRQTPTMGGVLLWFSVFVAMVLCGQWDQAYVLLGIGVVFAYAVIGFVDDYRKVILRDARGLQARWKFPLQVIVAALCAFFLYDVIGLDRHLSLPFLKTVAPDLGWWAIPFGTCVIVGASNAVNLTDGLDGLVSVPAVVAFFAYAVLAYVAGNMLMAQYLQVPWVPGSGELTVLCGAVIGAALGFLWFNAHPASVFMGDVGALPLGALLGFVALVTKNEILLMLIGGVFVIETLSVIVQVVSFKLTGKRILRMAPIHHHFELKGWPESKVIVRFWILAIVLALMSLATLKLR